MVYRRIISLATMTLAAGLCVAPETQAYCNPGKLASNSGYTVGGYSYQYVQFPGHVFLGGFVGRFWQTNGVDRNETTPGGFDINDVIFQSPYPGPEDFWVFNINLGGAGNHCPQDCLTVYIEDPQTDRAILWTARENGSQHSALNFSFTYEQFGTVVAPPGPRPRIVSSSRDGSIVTVEFEIPDVTPMVRGESTPCGTDGAVSLRAAYAVQSSTPQSNTPPSTDITAGWSQIGPNAPGAGPADSRNHDFDCSTASDWWLATGISVAGQPVRFVSTPVRIECDPNLADPTGSFKKIDRPHPDPGRQSRS